MVGSFAAMIVWPSCEREANGLLLVDRAASWASSILESKTPGQLQCARRVGRTLGRDQATDSARVGGTRHIEHVVQEVRVDAQHHLLSEMHRLEQRSGHGPVKWAEKVLVLHRIETRI